jgi:hypothetical protein
VSLADGYLMRISGQRGFGGGVEAETRVHGSRRGFCDPVAMDDRRTDLWLI